MKIVVLGEAPIKKAPLTSWQTASARAQRKRVMPWK